MKVKGNGFTYLNNMQIHWPLARPHLFWARGSTRTIVTILSGYFCEYNFSHCRPTRGYSHYSDMVWQKKGTHFMDFAQNIDRPLFHNFRVYAWHGMANPQNFGNFGKTRPMFRDIFEENGLMGPMFRDFMWKSDTFTKKGMHPVYYTKYVHEISWYVRTPGPTVSFIFFNPWVQKRQGSCTFSAIEFHDFSMTKSCKFMT